MPKLRCAKRQKDDITFGEVQTHHHDDLGRVGQRKGGKMLGRKENFCHRFNREMNPELGYKYR